MARLEDLNPVSQANIEALDCPVYDNKPWVSGPPLAQRKITLISSAGLMLRGEKTVGRGDPGYREIPHDTSDNDILMSHVSVNFDRTGFQQDLNVILPRQRLNELVAAGEIDAPAETHYSFMGATDPRKMKSHARELAQKLHTANVDSAVLIPV